MVDLEPVKYQKRTNIGEHNQIVDKVNEIITVMNDSDLEGLTGISDRVDTLETEMETAQTDITGLDTRLDTVESDIQGIDTEITGLNEHVVNSVEVSKGAATGQISVSVGFESAEPVSGSGSVNLSDVAKASTLAFAPSADSVAISLGVVEGTPKTTNLPVASATQAGVLKASDYAKIGEPYELPIASADTLGGIKVGANLSITPEGVLSASGGGGGAGEITSVVVESSDLGLTVGVNGVNSDPEPVKYLDAETMVVGTESPPASGNFVSGIKMGGGFGNDVVIGANVPSVGGSPTLRISGGDYDAITRVDILNVDGLEVKNNSNRLAVGGSNLALASEIPDTSGFLTKTDADADYQPKGSYLTSVPVAGSAIGGVKNGGNVVVDGSGNMNVTIPDVSGFITETEADSKYQPKGNYLTSVPVAGSAIGGVKNGGNVVVDGSGNMNVTIPDVSGFITETEADSKYQPKGSYLTSVPIGGASIGGVKNGGNVTINADGTMNAKASGGLTRTVIAFDGKDDFLNKFESCANYDMIEFEVLGNHQYVINQNSVFTVLKRETITPVLSGNGPLISQDDNIYYTVVYIEVNTAANIIYINYFDSKNQQIYSVALTSSDSLVCYGNIIHYE